MSRKRLCVLFSGGVLLLAAGGIMIPVVDMVIKEKIKDTVILSNSSENWDSWRHPSVPVYRQFYLFNVTNPEQVKNGKKPVLLQKGPYTYRANITKYDITFDKNGTVSYHQKAIYTFVSSMSAGNTTDRVTTANPTVLAAINSLRYQTPILKGLVSNSLESNGADLFTTRPVHELLWGYLDNAMDATKALYPKYFGSSFVGYYIKKNNTDQGLFTMFTGQNTEKNLGQMEAFNGHKSLGIWTSKTANMINGTDGSIYPPFEQETKNIAAFSHETCRSLNFVYQEEVKTTHNIGLRRFVISPSDFLNATANPDNLGFCTPQTHCLPTGLLNLSTCVASVTQHAPTFVASNPHFYMASTSVINSVDGMNPNAKEHETTLDMEPWTGLVLQAAKRLQINVQLIKDEDFPLSYNMPSLFLPIFWINESYVVDGNDATTLQKNLFVPMEFTSVLEKVFMIIGGILVLLVVVVVCRRRKQDKLRTMPPGPVPSMEANGTRVRRGKRQEKEKVPLLVESGGPPPAPPVTYPHPPSNNGHLTGVSVVPSKEPTYQTSLDA